MASNSRSYVLLAFVIGVVAVYAQYGGNAPSYPAQPPTVPIFVPYAAPPPPILPELPASHEILRPRRRHHHHHRRRHHSKRSSESKSKSNSDSREHRHHCKDCKKIKKSCAGADGNNCFTPDIYYFEYKGCRRAVITCDAIVPVKLETTQGAALTSSVGGQKIARCDKHNNWVSRDENGDKVDFSTVRCIPITEEVDEDAP